MLPDMGFGGCSVRYQVNIGVIVKTRMTWSGIEEQSISSLGQLIWTIPSAGLTTFASSGHEAEYVAIDSGAPAMGVGVGADVGGDVGGAVGGDGRVDGGVDVGDGTGVGAGGVGVGAMYT